MNSKRKIRWQGNTLVVEVVTLDGKVLETCFTLRKSEMKAIMYKDLEEDRYIKTYVQFAPDMKQLIFTDIENFVWRGELEELTNSFLIKFIKL